MTAPHVLVAAFSGRALAASARRAGFVPHVVDCFGDLDLEAASSRCLPARVQTGFKPRPLLAALEELAARAERPPVGLVLGTGFECDPRLLARLAERFRLLGCAPEVVRRTNDPATLFPLLDRLGIAHPETRLEAPERPDGWLMKRIGGSGGLHVLACPAPPRPDPRRYFQRRLEGTSVSVAAVAVGGSTRICGFTEQWCAPLPRRRYRYGGAATRPDIPDISRARMNAAAEALAPALGLTGLVSFDFLLSGETPYLLEVNPRPGATLDILDDDSGALFQAHVAAALGELLAREPVPSSQARAAAFLYADDGQLTIAALRWPAWSADRPRPGTLVGAHQPLATAFAEADTAAVARAVCTQRLGELRDLLYADQKNREGSAPMRFQPTGGVSVNARAGRIVDAVAADAAALRCIVSTGEAGERRIDMGAATPGGLEAGRRLGEICMGGLGTVAITSASGLEHWPLGVVVHSTNPVVACLGSQYAGWTITDEATGFFALGSGPARALSRVEELYKELGYADAYDHAALVIEGDNPPPAAVASSVASACGIAPSALTVLYAPTGSLAGTVQIAARVLEVALHKAHALHFPLENIVDGYGVAPIAPPIPDFVKAMGRTNDAIIYGGRIQLFVRGSDEEAKKLADELPSSSSSAYGKPFAEIFAEVSGDFYKIDAMLFSPAKVTVSNLDTGTSFHAGALAPEVVDASFR